MSWLAKVSFYLKSLFQRKQLDAQLTEEIRTHMEMATEANVAAGMSPEEARYAALREFGNVAGVQERTRDEHGWVWLEQFWKDCGFVLRALGRARWFSLTVILTLALGISVAAVVLTRSYWVLFRPLSYPEPERLVSIQTMDKAGGGASMNSCRGLQFQAYQELTNVFAEFAASEYSFANIVVDDALGTATVLSISPACFSTLGIAPALGRGFRPEEFGASAANVVIISDKCWREKLQAAPEVLGRQVNIDQQDYTVVGVLPASAAFPPMFYGDVYRPLILRLNPAKPLEPSVAVIGRLRPGVSREQATAALAGVNLPELPGWAKTYLSGREPVLGDLTYIPPKPYWLMLAGGALLYVSACLNAMNLMLARLLSRQRELGIRLALGASRWQIARLFLIESMGLSLMAGLLAAFSWKLYFPFLTELLTGGTTTITTQRSWWLGWGGLGLALGLSVIAGAAVALLPAWRVLKAGLSDTLKEGGPGYGEGRHMTRLRSGLVVLQASFAVILLVGTGLMVRSFERIQQADLGFDPVGKVKVHIKFPRDYDPKPETRLQLFERLTQRLAALPGVKGVTYGDASSLLGGEWLGTQVKMPDGTLRRMGSHSVAADYAQVAGLRLAKGRWFANRTGGATATNEVVINETMARQFFGERDPLGQALPNGRFTVVGVVHDIKGALREPVGAHYYYPAWLNPRNNQAIILRLDGNPPKEFAGVVQRAIYEIEPNLVVTSTRSIDQAIHDSLWSERFVRSALGALTPIALSLGMVGLFSVMAYNVETRRREFGVRLALGARPEDLWRLVLRRGLLTTAIGVLLGGGVAVGLTRFMQSLLFETTPYDPLVHAGVALALLFSATLACWLPAWRASKVDPVIALRAE